MVAFMREVLARMARNASRMLRRTSTTRIAIGGTAAKANSDNFQSKSSISVTMPISRAKSPTALSAPDANISKIASVSLVTRDTRRPTSCLSKKPSRSCCKNSNASRRRSATARAPATCTAYI